MATPLQIGGLINLEERSGSFLPELPYTNRGVIRQKEELSALIDWCQITIKEVPLEAVIEDVLRIPLELMTVTGYEKGIAGHEVVAIFDNIKVLKPTGNAQYQGFQILMSGKGCRNYENFLQLNEETWFDFLNRVCQYHINVPRIDLAIDDRKPYLSIPDLIVRTKEGLLSTKLREIDFHDSGELKEEVFQSKGGSLYLGSSASNLRLVFYEKGYEQNKKYGTELDENWNRYELRFRQEMAVSVVQELLRYRDVAGLAMEVLNSKIRFLEKPTDSMTTRKRLYPTYQAWAELMKDIGKVKLTMQPQKKSLQKVWEWLEKYVAPSLKLFAEVGKIEKRDYIGNLVKNGEMNITQKQLYDDYIKVRRLNGLSRAEVERGVLYHAQGILEDMGLENEVELLAARVHGSRSREELYRDDSDLDVVLSYRGNIREDSFFNELNAHGIAMAGIKVDINPIAEERITLAEYMKESEAYLDQKEIEKLAVDLDNFSYEYDTYEYKDIVENREEQVKKITEDILNKKTGCLKDWLVEVSEESDIDSDVITARSLLSRLENAETLSIFTRQPEQEKPEATITFYVAECMEFPVMGEYHNNLTLEEAIKIYESIPADRLHGGKGIGFDLQDGDEDYSGEYELMCWDRVDRELIDMIPHYKESPLVQKAINDMEKYLNEKHGKVQEAEQAVEVKQEVPEAPVKKESVSVEPNQTQKKEPVKGEKGELKKSVLQSLKEFQARAKAQEQKNKEAEKPKAHKKGDVEL